MIVNNVDPDQTAHMEQSDQGLYYLQFQLNYHISSHKCYSITELYIRGGIW